MNLSITYTATQPTSLDLLNDVRSRFSAHLSYKCRRLQSDNTPEHKQSLELTEMINRVHFMHKLALITASERDEILNRQLYAALTTYNKITLPTLSASREIGLSSDNQSERIVRMWLRHRFQTEFNSLLMHASGQNNLDNRIHDIDMAIAGAKCMRDCHIIDGGELLCALQAADAYTIGEVTNTRILHKE